ncbi:MAG: ABC transporter permease [Thermoanaerobaculia bacterium]
MKRLVLLLTALRSLLKNRLRTLLTMLGIIIGVAAVIVMVAIGRGAQSRIEREIASMGKNLLTIFSGAAQFGGVSRGGGSLSTLTLKDVDLLREQATLLSGVSPSVRVSSQAVVPGVNWQTTVFGVSPEYFEIRGWKLAQGEAFTERDVRSRSRSAVLGKTVVTNLFGDASPIGAEIRVGKVPLVVVGVLEEKGQSGFGNDQDDVILAPISTVMSRLSGGTNVQQIYVSVAEGKDSTAATEEIRGILRSSHRLGETEADDFNIRSQAEISAAAATTTQTFTLLLAAIASVSLLVGGIGIMNIMLVSVTERTREIGIRLAVGAKSRDVLVQFLIEAIVVSTLGGLLGVALGLALAEVLPKLAPFQTQVQPATVLMALGFAVAVGVFFGFSPARRAAEMDPIEALRYE